MEKIEFFRLIKIQPGSCSLTLLKLYVLYFLIIVSGGISAQEVFPATGGNSISTGGSVSYTVGQVVYTLNSGTNGTVAQGIQQPYEISIVTGLDENNVNLSFSVYPNPAHDYLNLEVVNFENENLKYSLYSINGSLLSEKQIDGLNSGINLTPYFSSVFILRVSDDQKIVKTFKIIKK